jgi:hypothetical protein
MVAYDSGALLIHLRLNVSFDLKVHRRSFDCMPPLPITSMVNGDEK